MIVAISVAVHAAVLLAIHVHWIKPATPAEAKAAATPLDYSCAADASLVASARLAYCATPFAATGPAPAGAPGGGFHECAGYALSQYRYELITCQGQKQAAALDKASMKVALVNPKQIDKIDPKKLAKIDVKKLEKIKPKPLVPIPPVNPKQQAKQEQKQIEKKHEQAVKREQRRRPNGQVVEVTQPKVEIQPDHAHYVSEYDTKVQQETVARGSTEKMVARPGPKNLPSTKANPHPDVRRPDTAAGPIQQPRDKGDPDSDRGKGHGKNSKLAMRTPTSNKTPGNLGGFERLAMNGTVPQRGQGGLTRERRIERQRRQKNEGGGRGALFKKMAPRNLRPSDKLLSRLAGGGSVDDLDGVKKGQITALNSKRWKFATFFNRLKRQVAQNWHPDRVYMQRDPTGRIYGTKDRITILRVSLNRDGSIHQVYIVRGCGVDFLDDEAVRAFHAAQPFPHPPMALVDAGTHLITFSFGFHFEINDGADTWRIFRYQ